MGHDPPRVPAGVAVPRGRMVVGYVAAANEVGLRALFSRFPGLHPAGEPVLRDTRLLRGYLRAPVHLTVHRASPAQVADARASPCHPIVAGRNTGHPFDDQSR